jgi:hypothetical protein
LLIPGARWDYFAGIRLADSPLFQHFCGLSELDRIQVPSKSTLQRYSQWTDEAAVRSLVDQLNQQAHFHPKKLRLRAPLDLEACFLDTTCVQANIHYPVDCCCATPPAR